MPLAEDLPLLDTDPAKVRAQAYDLVINGEEAGGGTIRCHDPMIQSKIFALLGLTPEEAEEKFGFLLSALRNGAPPHGGIALGFDRLAMLYAGLTNIRDCIAFPKTAKGDRPHDRRTRHRRAPTAQGAAYPPRMSRAGCVGSMMLPVESGILAGHVDRPVNSCPKTRRRIMMTRQGMAFRLAMTAGLLATLATWRAVPMLGDDAANQAEGDPGQDGRRRRRSRRLPSRRSRCSAWRATSRNYPPTRRSPSARSAAARSASCSNGSRRRRTTRS